MNTDITSDDKLWAALSYPIFIVALIMLLVEGKKNRPFIKFHAVQALALNVGVWLVEILLGILTGILSHGLGILGVALGCIRPFIWLLLLWPAYLAYMGKYFEVPVVTKFLRDQHWVV